MKIKYLLVGLTNSSRGLASPHFKGGSTTKVRINDIEKYSRILILKVDEDLV